MLLKLLDNNSPVSFIINAIFLIITAIGFSLSGYVAVNWLFIANTGLLMATFLLLNVMSDKFHLFKELTYLSSFVLLLLSVTVFPYFDRVFIGGYLFLFTWYLFLVLSIYHQTDAKNIAFNAGFLIGLFYLADKELLLFGVLLFIMLLLSRAFYWREWLLGFLGMALPAFYVELFRQLHISLSFLSVFSLNGYIILQPSNAWLLIAATGLLILLTLLYLGRKTVRKRNIYTTLTIAPVLTLILFFTVNNIAAIVLTFPALAVLIVHLYHQLNKPVFRWLTLFITGGIVAAYYFL